MKKYPSTIMYNGPDIERNLQIPLTPGERQTFRKLSSQEPKNPIDREYRGLAHAQAALTGQLRAVMNGMGGKTKAQAIDGLYEEAANLNGKLRDLSDAVVDNTGPEEAVSILASIYSHHDRSLSRDIIAAAKRGMMIHWSKEYIGMFARSYADPEGITAMTLEQEAEIVFTRDEVMRMMDEKIRGKLHDVLPHAKKNFYETRARRKRRFAMGSFAVGAFFAMRKYRKRRQ